VTAEEIVAALRSGRFTYTDEVALHADMSRVLDAHGLEHHREVNLGPGHGRIDFMVDRVGIEVKVAGAPANVLRQLSRYATSASVDALVLVTTVARHRVLPDVLHVPDGAPVPVHRFDLAMHQAF
jgi:hypothetical protein